MPPEPPPAISVSARGEVQVAPDRARVQVGVETQAKTSAAAAAENNQKQAAVLKAIRALGIPQAQIRTLNYSVMPMQRYDDKLKRVVIDGYQVSNIVSVETEKLELAGQIIDAGLANGANRVAGLDFFVKDRAKAQEEALAQAVATARR
ncbi:MAG: SIMPL domain-containing protein [Gemmatimonadaceae bacterium]|nr:SIMPL domain-containing protein [Gemmatimonadaceae bacterium]